PPRPTLFPYTTLFRSWLLDGARLSEEIGAPVTLMNDLEATAWGLPVLGPDDLATLQSGRPAPGSRALIAAGTGLGECMVPWDGRSEEHTSELQSRGQL